MRSHPMRMLAATLLLCAWIAHHSSGNTSQTSPAQTAPATQNLPTFIADFDTALQKAKAEHKVLLVDFYGPTCPYCDRMMRTVYPDPQVIERSRNFIWARVDVTTGPGVALYQKFRAKSTPTYFAIGYDGSTTYWRLTGAISLKGFLHNTSLLEIDAGELAAARSKVQNKTASLAERLLFAKGELMEGRRDTGRAALNAIATDDPTNASGTVDDALLLLGMTDIVTTPLDAYNTWKRIIQQFTTSDRAADAVLYINRLLRETGDTAKAPRISALIKNYPEGTDVAAVAKILEEP